MNPELVSNKLLIAAPKGLAITASVETTDAWGIASSQKPIASTLFAYPLLTSTREFDFIQTLNNMRLANNTYN